jgi:hypothetical protein
LSVPRPVRSLPLSLCAWWDQFVGADSLWERVPFSHCPAEPARQPVRPFGCSLSLARGPCPSDPSSSSATVAPMACALPARPVSTSARPTQVARTLGKAPHTPSARPCLTFSFPPPLHSPSREAVSPSRRFPVPPSPLDLCQRFGLDELRLGLVHREPAVVSPFLNSIAQSGLSLFPMQVGVRRRHDPSMYS